MPIYRRLVCLAATHVEPEPQQLSKTISFSFEYVCIRYRNNANGFWVG